MSAIGSAIRDGRCWLDRFTRREYRKAFREYTAAHWDGCRMQLDAGREDPAALACQVIAELEEALRKVRFWNRGTERFDQKQMLIKYFCPMPWLTAKRPSPEHCRKPGGSAGPRTASASPATRIWTRASST